MAKIKDVEYRNEYRRINAVLNYKSDLELFYIRLDDIGQDGIREFLESQVKTNDDIDHMRLSRIGVVTGIFTATQKQAEDAFNLFVRDFFDAKIDVQKAILLQLSYKTETQNNSDWRYTGVRKEEKNPGKLELSVLFEIVEKKTFGEKFTYYKDGHRVQNYKYSEVPWTQELEDFLKRFSKSFDGLVDLFRLHLTTPEDIKKLAGKNILSNL